MQDVIRQIRRTGIGGIDDEQAPHREEGGQGGTGGGRLPMRFLRRFGIDIALKEQGADVKQHRQAHGGNNEDNE
jgi:hypothetical protein